MFQGLQAKDCWVARASWDEVVVCLVGLRWPHENLTLVSISDATPYFQGRARLLPAREGPGDPDDEDDGWKNISIGYPPGSVVTAEVVEAARSSLTIGSDVHAS